MNQPSDYPCNMNRRSFITSIGAAAGLALIPKRLLALNKATTHVYRSLPRFTWSQVIDYKSRKGYTGIFMIEDWNRAWTSCFNLYIRRRSNVVGTFEPKPLDKVVIEPIPTVTLVGREEYREMMNWTFEDGRFLDIMSSTDFDFYEIDKDSHLEIAVLFPITSNT